MNENINITPQESKLGIYLVVAAKIIVYILLMLGFAGVLGAVCIKAVSFFKIDGILKEVVMQSSFLAGTFLAAWVLLKNWGPPSDYRLGLIPERGGLKTSSGVHSLPWLSMLSDLEYYMGWERLKLLPYTLAHTIFCCLGY